MRVSRSVLIPHLRRSMKQSLLEFHGQNPWFLVLFFELLHIAICYPTRKFGHIRNYIVGPVMIALAYSMFNNDLQLHVKNKYAVGFHISFQLCSMICFVYIGRGFPDVWRRVKDEPSAAAGTVDDESMFLPSDFTFKRKIGWMMDLTYSPRRVGWVQEPRGVLPRHPTCSRWHFIWSRILYALMNVVLLDLAVSYQAGNPSFDTSFHHPGETAYMAARPLWARLPDIIAWGVMMVNGICLSHTMIAIPSVGLGLSEPGDWPAMFGSFWDMYTVRQFWGRSWHQRLRFMLSSVGKHIAYTVCGFKPGTMASSYTQLFSAFLVSGLVHTGGDYLVSHRLTLFTLRFFLLQAVAISFEDFVMWLAKPLSAHLDRRIARTIGYIWVLGWFCFSAPIWFDPLTAANLHLMERGHMTTKVLDLWARCVSSLSPMTIPVTLNSTNFYHQISRVSGFEEELFLQKALDICI